MLGRKPEGVFGVVRGCASPDPLVRLQVGLERTLATGTGTAHAHATARSHTRACPAPRAPWHACDSTGACKAQTRLTSAWCAPMGACSWVRSDWLPRQSGMGCARRDVQRVAWHSARRTGVGGASVLSSLCPGPIMPAAMLSNQQRHVRCQEIPAHAAALSRSNAHPRRAFTRQAVPCRHAGTWPLNTGVRHQPCGASRRLNNPAVCHRQRSARRFAGAAVPVIRNEIC